MKTTTTPTLHFSVYPAEWSETKRPQFPELPGKIREKTKADTSQANTVPLQDVPENWSESWFANYE